MPPLHGATLFSSPYFLYYSTRYHAVHVLLLKLLLLLGLVFRFLDMHQHCCRHGTAIF